MMAHCLIAATDKTTQVENYPEKLLRVRNLESHVLYLLTCHVQGLMVRQSNL